MNNAKSIYVAIPKKSQIVILIAILTCAAVVIGCPEAEDMMGDVIQPFEEIDPNVDLNVGLDMDPNVDPKVDPDVDP